MHNTYFLKEYYTIKSKEHLYMQNKTFLKTPRSAPAWIQLWYWLDVEFLFYHICYSINKKRSRRSKGAYPLPLCHSKSHRCVSQLQHITLSPSQKVPLHIPVNGTTQSYFPKWLWSPSKAKSRPLAASTLMNSALPHPVLSCSVPTQAGISHWSPSTSSSHFVPWQCSPQPTVRNNSCQFKWLGLIKSMQNRSRH